MVANIQPKNASTCATPSARRQRRQLEPQPVERARLHQVEAPHQREHEAGGQRGGDAQRNLPAPLAKRARRKQQRRQHAREQQRHLARAHQRRPALRQPPSDRGRHAVTVTGAQAREDDAERVQRARQREHGDADLEPNGRLRQRERDRRQDGQEREADLEVEEMLRQDVAAHHRPAADRGEEQRDHDGREPHRPRIQLAAAEQAGERGHHHGQRQDGGELEQERSRDAHGVRRVRAGAAGGQRRAWEEQPARQPVDEEFQEGNDDEKRRQVPGAGAPHGGFHGERRIILMLSRVKASRDSVDENPEAWLPTGVDVWGRFPSYDLC